MYVIYYVYNCMLCRVFISETILFFVQNKVLFEVNLETSIDQFFEYFAEVGKQWDWSIIFWINPVVILVNRDIFPCFIFEGNTPLLIEWINYFCQSPRYNVSYAFLDTYMTGVNSGSFAIRQWVYFKCNFRWCYGVG